MLWLTLFANLAVVAAKAAAGFAAGALSVVAEATHSAVDAMNNVMGLALSRLAAEEPDERHPYGHVKFETLGALAVVAFLSITVYELVSGAIERLVAGTARPQVGWPIIAVMAGSAVVSLIVARYESRHGRRLHSELLLADAAHTGSDVFASLTVLLGLGLVALGYPRADAAFTIFVAVIIARAGWRIIRRTVPVLVDERAVAAETIRQIALRTEGVRDTYDVRSRGRGTAVFAELTIAVDAGLDVHAAHVIADAVERRVVAALNAREVVVHIEPAPAARP